MFIPIAVWNLPRENVDICDYFVLFLSSVFMFFIQVCFMHFTSLLTSLLTYSMKQSPFREANRFSASQEIP
jgi:hypothetical protein